MGQRTGWQGSGPRREKISLFSVAFRLALSSTQPSYFLYAYNLYSADMIQSCTKQSFRVCSQSRYVVRTVRRLFPASATPFDSRKRHIRFVAEKYGIGLGYFRVNPPPPPNLMMPASPCSLNIVLSTLCRLDNDRTSLNNKHKTDLRRNIWYYCLRYP
jgi:hypothetical protein